MATYLKEINREIQDFRYKQIQIMPGLFFNQWDTLERIYFYYNSKFKTGEIDTDGDKKYFFNIVKNPCKVFSKAIDFDTKNIRLLTAGGGDPLKTWFMERDLKLWMREKDFGAVLNRIFHELPIFGSVVIKNVKGTPYFVDLRNFIVDQGADDLDCSGHIIEVHNLTPAQFKKIAKSMAWDKAKVDETLKLFYDMKGMTHIRLYERYGDVPEVDEKGSTTYVYKRMFIADVGFDEYDMYGTLIMARPGVELSSEEWEGHPYWEFHAEKMPGRWLGIGVVETLFEPQVRENELANVQAKSTYWAGLRIFQTRDNAVNRNLYTGAQNGEILITDAPIEPVNIDDRNLAYFNQETAKWLQNRSELTFSYDVVQGERLPAGTPLGSAQIAQTQTLSYFETIQENVALSVKGMLYEVILPYFEKESTQEHIIRLVGQDLDLYAEMIKNQLVLQEIIRVSIDSFGSKFPTPEDKAAIEVAIEESIKQGKEKLITIPKDFYKDLKYDLDIDITGESVDTRVRYATRFAIIQAITADPTMTTDPVKRKLLAGMAEDGGINPAEFLGVPSTKLPESAIPKPSGGGVSAPVMGSPIAGQAQSTV